MKNFIQTLFAAVVTVVLTSLSAATHAAEQGESRITSPTTLTFNRILVSGNVKLVLTQGDQHSVEAIENYDSSKTSVMSRGRTLYINSKESELVRLNITMKDLERVKAHGAAIVVTSNTFDVKNLQVFLYDNAYARIKTTVKSLYIVVKSEAILKLKGTADQSTIMASRMKNVKLGDFVSQNSSSYVYAAIAEADTDEMTLSIK